jgi:hypothetical protein
MSLRRSDLPKNQCFTMITQQQPLDAKTQSYMTCLIQLRQLENAIEAQHAKRRWANWLGIFLNRKILNAELKRLFAEQIQVQLQMLRLRPTNNPLVCLDNSDEE